MTEVLKQALEKIANVNAMDYEYQRWAREALAIAELESQEPVCPECKAEVLYECVACSRNNYPPQRKCENCGEFGTCCLKTESQERNFCPRCGKRTNYIHTCTPPKEGA